MQTGDAARIRSWANNWTSPGAMQLCWLSIKHDFLNIRHQITFASWTLVTLLLCIFPISRFQPWFDRAYIGASIFLPWSYLTLIALFGGCYYHVTSVICREKERGTMGLMKLTGIKPIGFLYLILGTGFAKLLPIVVLHAPLVALAIAIGDFNPEKVFSVITILIAFAILTFGMSFYFSVISRNSTESFVRFCGVCLLIAILYFMLAIPLSIVQWQQDSLIFSSQIIYILEFIIGMLSSILPPVRLFEALSIRNSASKALAYFLFCLLVSGRLIHLGLRRFEECSDQIEPEGSLQQRQGILTRQNEVDPSDSVPDQTGKPRVRRSMRCWENPYLWREFRFVIGGWTAVSGGAISMFILFFTMALISMFPNQKGPLSLQQASEGLFRFSCGWLAIGTFLLVFGMLCTLSTLLSNELTDKTLGTLLITGAQVRQVFWQLYRGRARLLLHAIAPLFLGCAGLFFSYLIAPSHLEMDEMFLTPLQILAVVLCGILIAVYLVIASSLVFIRSGLIPSQGKQLLAGSPLILAFVSCFAVFVLLANGYIPYVTRQAVPFVYLGFLASICLLTAPFLNRLCRSIDRAIQNRMADN
ncbi:MAG: hypothetical protein KDA68_05815 [Planctomycetaceae bacterium]|nr:hypothetical protein [Planctomycetaceae bacterium]